MFPSPANAGTGVLDSPSTPANRLSWNSSGAAGRGPLASSASWVCASKSSRCLRLCDGEAAVLSLCCRLASRCPRPCFVDERDTLSALREGLSLPFSRSSNINVRRLNSSSLASHFGYLEGDWVWWIAWIGKHRDNSHTNHSEAMASLRAMRTKKRTFPRTGGASDTPCSRTMVCLGACIGTWNAQRDAVRERTFKLGMQPTMYPALFNTGDNKRTAHCGLPGQRRPSPWLGGGGTCRSTT
jgi:hypothetical protein